MSLHFEITHPVQGAQRSIQAVWFAALTGSQCVQKTLYSDAGSGVLLNFTGGIVLQGRAVPKGIVVLPNSLWAQVMSLSPGAILSGVRFYPAVGYSILGEMEARVSMLSTTHPLYLSLHRVYERLCRTSNAAEHIDVLTQWADQHCLGQIPPVSLSQFILSLCDGKQFADVSQELPLSQRQLERQFKQWLGMSPKYFQQITRVKRSITHLKRYPSHPLADVAALFGFSDQAHMTREFRRFAQHTPAQIRGPQLSANVRATSTP